MPYVDLARRVLLNAGARPDSVGECTYAIQQVLRRYLGPPGYVYANIAECLGALEGAKADFVERIVKPYEETKCEQNGDVW